MTKIQSHLRESESHLQEFVRKSVYKDKQAKQMLSFKRDLGEYEHYDRQKILARLNIFAPLSVATSLSFSTVNILH